MMEYPFWIGGSGWLGAILFWVIVAVVFYKLVKWLNSKL